jgi:thioredoxin
MSNIRSLSDLNRGGSGGNRGGGGGGGMPPAGGGGMPPGGGGGMPPGGGGGGFLGSLFGGMFGGGGAGSGEDHKRVKVLHHDAEFQRELSAAGNRLVVVDFSAVWCGPCKVIGPIFAQLSEQYPNVVFLKVDVDEMQQTAQQCGISAMPTFQFFHRGIKIDEFKGANPSALQQALQRHSAAIDGQDASAVQGSAPSGGGHRLGGGEGHVLGGGGDRFPAGGHPLGGGGGRPLGGSPVVSPQPTPAPAPQQAPPIVQQQEFVPDPVMMQSLMEMGFPQNRADKAMRVVKNASVQAAMDWIFEHMDDPDIDEPAAGATPAAAPSPTQDVPMKETAAPTTAPPVDASKPPTVHNALCNVCQNQIVGIRYKCKTCPDYDMCEQCKAKSTHDPSHEFAAHTEDIVNPTLTPEERALQQKRLQERLEEIRKKRTVDEEEREREREIARRRDGKDAVEARKKWEEAQAKREEDLRRKEKLEEKAAKERVKQMLLQDKMEREAKKRQQQMAQAAPQSQPQPQPQPQQQKTYTECQIQVRLTNGQVLRATFKPTDTIRTVQQYVQHNRTDGAGAFTLANTFPRKVYTGNDLDTTLADAGLVPNGTLLVSK